MKPYDRLDADEARAAAAAAAAARKRCSRCGKEKPRAAFCAHPTKRDGLQSWCRTCLRVWYVMYRRTPEYRAWHQEYHARPEVQAKQSATAAAYDQRCGEKRREQRRAYYQTARGKVMACRARARYLLRRATDPARIARLSALVALHDAELARMDLRARELPAPRRAAP